MPVTGFNILSHQLIAALSKTLLHSLWQGLILALVAALVTVCTRRSAAALRYNLLLGTLVAFSIMTVYTFANELSVKANTDQSVISISANGHPGATQIQVEALNVRVSPDWKAGAISFFSVHQQQLVAIWLLVVAVKCLQLLTGMQGLHFLRRRKLVYADDTWQQRIEDLCRQMGISQMVLLAESALTKVPMMVGHFKPLILVPMGLLTALPPAEIDAIIIHELAHIRRKDYLVNLLQSLLEVFFFFNPAVLWVSALLKRERENCCDDLVIAQTGNHIPYIKALLACQEYNNQPQLAMALAGKKGSLLDRVNRMLSGGNASLNKAERLILALCLLFTCVFSVGYSNPQAVKQITKQAVAIAKKVEAKVAPVSKPLPVAEEAPIAKEKEPAQVGAPADTSRKSSEKQLIKMDAKLQPLTGNMGSLDIPADVTKAHNINTIKAMAQADSIAQSKRLGNLGRFIGPLGPINVNVNTNIDSIKRFAKIIAKEPKVKGPVYTTYKSVYKPYRADTVRKQPVKPAQARVDAGNLGKLIIADMLKDGIVTKTDLISFKLGTKGFVVNGETQPDDVYQRYKQKFVPEAQPGHDWEFYHDFDDKKPVKPTSAKTEEKP